MRHKYIISFIIALLMSISGFAEGHSEMRTTKEKEFDAKGMIMGHIIDANEWHLWTTTDADGHEHHVSIPLPVIVWDGNFKIFMSSKVAHGNTYKGYTLSEGVLTSVDGMPKANIVDLFTSLDGKYVDLSITKNTAAMLISVLLIFFLFFAMARSYGKNNLKPRGIAAFLEPIVVFVREEIAVPNIGENKSDKFLPYLLTVFFFIWINNLLGLLPVFPGGANVTGNIAVTMVLALCTMIIVNVNGNKHYWKEIFTPDVPVPMYIIMIPVEIIGIFTKPFALMIRLFANITAGHIVVLSLLGMIFIFKSMFASVGAIPMTIFVLLLELLVAVLQAYIFTVLSALFIGMSVKKHY